MIISFYGAAKSVTGSKHLITLKSGKRILLDCGMFQGMKGQAYDLNKEFLFDPSSVDFLILSHAHLDHSGLIPLLVKKGFKGRIICTSPTKELTSLILEDSSKIQEIESKSKIHSSENKVHEPLYSHSEVLECLNLFETLPYNHELEVEDEFKLTFTDAGHILGSAVINLECKEGRRKKKICFTGDLGRYSNRILKAPERCPEADIVICESTYGDGLHHSIDSSELKLLKVVSEVCIDRKGKLLIPAFSIGRTQELIYSLNKLAEEKKIPPIPVFVDSPLSVYATNIIKEHMDCFNESMKEYIQKDPDPFSFPGISYIVDHEESKLLQAIDQPCVIISTSGMMDAGRIQYHVKNNLSDPANAVLITGYCEPSTLGGKITRGEKEVEILGELVSVNAEIIFMKEYSAHADYGDLLLFLSQQNKEKLTHLFLVHGEEDTMHAFKSKLEKEGFHNIEIPDFRISYQV
jgi:metallo-beta-lactamase family protein